MTIESVLSVVAFVTEGLGLTPKALTAVETKRRLRSFMVIAFCMMGSNYGAAAAIDRLKKWYESVIGNRFDVRDTWGVKAWLNRDLLELASASLLLLAARGESDQSK